MLFRVLDPAGVLQHEIPRLREILRIGSRAYWGFCTYALNGDQCIFSVLWISAVYLSCTVPCVPRETTCRSCVPYERLAPQKLSNPLSDATGSPPAHETSPLHHFPPFRSLSVPGLKPPPHVTRPTVGARRRNPSGPVSMPADELSGLEGPPPVRHLDPNPDPRYAPRQRPVRCLTQDQRQAQQYCTQGDCSISGCRLVR